MSRMIATCLLEVVRTLQWETMPRSTAPSTQRGCSSGPSRPLPAPLCRARWQSAATSAPTSCTRASSPASPTQWWCTGAGPARAGSRRFVPRTESWEATGSLISQGRASCTWWGAAPRSPPPFSWARALAALWTGSAWRCPATPPCSPPSAPSSSGSAGTASTRAPRWPSSTWTRRSASPSPPPSPPLREAPSPLACTCFLATLPTSPLRSTASSRGWCPSLRRAPWCSPGRR
mmetsp:Transcript_48466/g.90267  ORF Transcript_48466/g.90267 Transcript_48466/m.90267 type:complete len:233 (-) Transcript_48466:907-1605(-)